MDLLTRQLERRLLTTRDTDAFLFATPDGEHLDYSNWLHRVWDPARQHARVEWAQFHDLRRANATGLILEGIDLRRPKPGSVTPTPGSPLASTPRPPLKPTGRPRNGSGSASCPDKTAIGVKVLVCDARWTRDGNQRQTSRPLRRAA
jgi:hypothetical protein